MEQCSALREAEVPAGVAAGPSDARVAVEAVRDESPAKASTSPTSSQEIREEPASSGAADLFPTPCSSDSNSCEEAAGQGLIRATNQ